MRIKKLSQVAGRVLPLALLCLLPLIGIAGCPAQAATTVKRGDTLPIYLAPAAQRLRLRP